MEKINIDYKKQIREIFEEYCKDNKIKFTEKDFKDFLEFLEEVFQKN